MLFTFTVHKNLARQPRKSVAIIQNMAFHVDGVPRYETPNPYGYNEAALVEKTRVLKELAQLYPDVNPMWREWVYDVCANTPSDQLEDMKRRVATNPGKHANPCGGVLRAAYNFLSCV